jgi:hypothetical protein
MQEENRTITDTTYDNLNEIEQAKYCLSKTEIGNYGGPDVYIYKVKDESDREFEANKKKSITEKQSEIDELVSSIILLNKKLILNEEDINSIIKGIQDELKSDPKLLDNFNNVNSKKIESVIDNDNILLTDIQSGNINGISLGNNIETTILHPILRKKGVIINNIFDKFKNLIQPTSPGPIYIMEGENYEKYKKLKSELSQYINESINCAHNAKNEVQKAGNLQKSRKRRVRHTKLRKSTRHKRATKTKSKNNRKRI